VVGEGDDGEADEDDGGRVMARTAEAGEGDDGGAG
jgi:hypothetical protein